MFSPSLPIKAHALLVERLDRADTVRLHRAQDTLGERLELLVLRHGLGLAADADDRADATVDDHADEALGRLPVGPLAGLSHSLLAQQRAGGIEVAAPCPGALACNPSCPRP